MSLFRPLRSQCEKLFMSISDIVNSLLSSSSIVKIRHSQFEICGSKGLLGRIRTQFHKIYLNFLTVTVNYTAAYRMGMAAIKKSKYRVLCAILGDGTGLSIS